MNITYYRKDKDLYTQIATYNDQDAINYISGSIYKVHIHRNSTGDGSVNGAEVLVHPRCPGALRNIAQTICDNLAKQLGIPNRGVKEREDLLVLNYAPTSSILIETDFISCKSNKFKADVIGDIIYRAYNGRAGEVKVIYGHGAGDSGAVGNGQTERDTVRQIQIKAISTPQPVSTKRVFAKKFDSGIVVENNKTDGSYRVVKDCQVYSAKSKNRKSNKVYLPKGNSYFLVCRDAGTTVENGVTLTWKKILLGFFEGEYIVSEDEKK